MLLILTGSAQSEARGVQGGAKRVKQYNLSK